MNSLEEVLLISQRMLLLSEQDAWDGIVTAQHERDQLLQVYEKSAQPLTSSDRDVMEQILAINEQIFHAANAEKERCLQSHTELKTGKTALSAYQLNGYH